MVIIDKVTLRSILKEQRSSISQHEVIERNNKIFENLIKLDKFVEAENIFVYISTNNEVDTKDLIKYLLKDNKKVFAPKVISNNEMHFYPIYSLESLKLGAFNILEPEVTSRSVLPTDKDVVLVPGLGFDLEKNRLGYGGGYYDRYINALETKPIKIALAYDFQIIDTIPTEEYDVIMDIIITDKRIII